jgi:L-threonylcarbamoyladenylate synthase
VIAGEGEISDHPTESHLSSLLLESEVKFSETADYLTGKDTFSQSEDSTRTHIEEFSRNYGIPVERRLLVQAGTKLSIFCDLKNLGTETVLPEVLTICFHTYSDMASWILSHPSPYKNLLQGLQEGAGILREGGLVVLPTETVYGLGADATNPVAVQKIFAAKKRPFYDPLIVHVSDTKQMLPLVTEFPEKAKALTAHFWPGPLTVVLPKSSLVPSIVTADSPSVAIRMPSNPLARELIRLAGKPIAAPSANLFGCTSPTTAQHVEQQLGGTYDAIIDGGACIVGIESTVISFLGKTPRILRPGGIDQKAIEACIGKVLSDQHDSVEESTTSPGMLPSHYATATPLQIVENPSDYASRSDVGVLLFGKSTEDFHGPVEYLSLSSDPKEAAKRLYQAMRKLDRLSLSLIVVKLLPETGIGIAVNNRLRKAANNH